MDSFIRVGPVDVGGPRDSRQQRRGWRRRKRENSKPKEHGGEREPRLCIEYSRRRDLVEVDILSSLRGQAQRNESSKLRISLASTKESKVRLTPSRRAP